MTDDLDLRAQARIGHVLNDKWRLERLLGVGGMAAVYAARHRNGAKAAVKVLHSELGADADVKQRFLHEGYAANKVEHPNAVQVLDDDQVTSGAPGDEGTAYLVMELLDGESLLEHARREGKALPESEVLAIAEQVLDVLDAAHKHGIVHRDLKPENLFLVKGTGDTFPAAASSLSAMLAPPLRVKVLDFGIARIAEGGGKTRVGIALGTPTYMAPEQASGRRDEIDGRTDLFALAATMWRLLTGKRIHDAPSSAEILAKMATMPAPLILSVAPHISPHVAHVIDCALRFRPTDRYPDARTMRDDVRAVLEGRPPPYASTHAEASERRTAADLPAARVQPSFAPGGMERTGLATVGEIPRTNDHGSDPRLSNGPIPPTTAYPQISPHGLPAAAYPMVEIPARRSRTRLFVGIAAFVVVGLAGGAMFLISGVGRTAPAVEVKSTTAEGEATEGDEPKISGKGKHAQPAAEKPSADETDETEDDGDDDDDSPSQAAEDPAANVPIGGSHGNATAQPLVPSVKPVVTTKPPAPKTTAKPPASASIVKPAVPMFTVAPPLVAPPSQKAKAAGNAINKQK